MFLQMSGALPFELLRVETAERRAVLLAYSRHAERLHAALALVARFRDRRCALRVERLEFDQDLRRAFGHEPSPHERQFSVVAVDWVSS